MSYPNNSFIKTATVYYSKKSSEFQVYFKMKDNSTVKKTCKDGKLAELYPGSFLAYTQAEIIEVILESEILLYYKILGLKWSWQTQSGERWISQVQATTTPIYGG